MLEIANLEVVYNEVILVLRGLSIEVRNGQIVALLGANGAGKTTVTRAVTGLLDVHEGKITKGSVTLEGRRIDGDDPSAIVRSGITQVMEGRRVFAELTVDENLITGGITNVDRKAIVVAHDRVMTMFPLLADRRKDVAGYLSGGEQQMLAIGRALMADPKLLILDEPSLGLAPKLVAKIRDTIVAINEAGTSVLSYSSSRTPTWPSRSPTTATSWRPARSSWTAMPTSSSRTRTSRSSTSACTATRANGSRSGM